jgi:hypothetical protein
MDLGEELQLQMFMPPLPLSLPWTMMNTQMELVQVYQELI